MAVRKEGKGWVVDVTLGGRGGQRVREFGYKTSSLAKAREKEIKDEFYNGKGIKKSESLKDFVMRWYECHGKLLKDHRTRLNRTLAIVDRLGNPSVYRFSAVQFSDYRTQRLAEVSVSTVNHETRYLRAVFNEMKRLGQYQGDNPLSLVRTFKEKQRELGFLTSDQIKILLDSCAKSTNNHTLVVTKLCLATGARWGEANSLKRQYLNVRNNRVRYVDTKNGSNRTVPISKELVEEILEVSHPTSNDLFSSCRSAFRAAVKRSGLQLPEGQLTHILRHSFASHFMMNGGDILTLQKILGHTDLKMTMRYSHMSPDYLERVISLNPINNLEI